MTNNVSRNIPKPLDPPEHSNLPFFAYGVFKPGQLAFSKIEKFVNVKKIYKKEINYRMLLRDGVPLIEPKKNENFITKGFLVYFKEGLEEDAYEVISKTESEQLYEWKEIKIGPTKANVLVGVNPRFGSTFMEGNIFEYHGEEDPFFKEAIGLIEKNLKELNNPKTMDLNECKARYGADNREECKDRQEMDNFFTLQMNYMLLWSAIDRYASLKYDIHDFAQQRKNREDLASEDSFIEALDKFVEEHNYRRDIFSSESMRMFTFKKDNPKYCINYFYTIRCNVVHRGKEFYGDKSLVRQSLEDLLKIFKRVLNETFKDAEYWNKKV